MEKYSNKTNNKYVISVHEDVANLFESLKQRTKELGLEHLTFVDTFLCGKLFEHLQN